MPVNLKSYLNIYIFKYLNIFKDLFISFESSNIKIKFNNIKNIKIRFA